MSCNSEIISGIQNQNFYPVRETQFADDEHFEDSLNSPVETFELSNDIKTEKQSFGEICDEFTLFLTDEDEPIIKSCTKKHGRNKICENIAIDKNYEHCGDSNDHDVSYKVVDSTSELFDMGNCIEDSPFSDDQNMSDNNSNVSDHDELIYFQDVNDEMLNTDCNDSDFESSLIINCLTTSKSTRKDNSKLTVPNPVQRTDKIIEEKEKNKATVLSNSLLRSTIQELEKALNDSNELLARRDLKIQELRKENASLQTQLNEHIESTTQLKLALLEKEALSSENETEIVKLKKSLKELVSENNALRLYKLNNSVKHDTSTGSIDECSSSTCSEESSTLSCVKEQKTTCPRRKTHCESINSMKDIKRSTMGEKSERFCSRDNLRKNSKPKCPRRSTSTSSIARLREETIEASKASLNQNENHAHIRMKFMRDAFFYYMIGFHSDEQINAILAILDYGDKRQEFVLEAHKLKKLGKKMNISKMSSRGLSEKIEKMSV